MPFLSRNVNIQRFGPIVLDYAPKDFFCWHFYAWRRGRILIMPGFAQLQCVFIFRKGVTISKNVMIISKSVTINKSIIIFSNSVIIISKSAQSVKVWWSAKVSSKECSASAQIVFPPWTHLPFQSHVSPHLFDDADNADDADDADHADDACSGNYDDVQ